MNEAACLSFVQSHSDCPHPTKPLDLQYDTSLSKGSTSPTKLDHQLSTEKMEQPTRKRRDHTSEVEDSSSAPPAKIPKVTEGTAAKSSDAVSRPKNRKELRKERKEALKAAKDNTSDILVEDAVNDSTKSRVKLSKADSIKQKQQLRREERKAQKAAREGALDARFEEQKRLQKAKQEEAKSAKQQPSKKEKKESSKTNEEVDSNSAVYKSIFKKSAHPTTGTTLCRLGVQYVDEKVGVGPKVASKSLVTVKYQLRGGSRNGVLIDSSKKFSFRLGKGEVIQGWEIGLEGMRQGGLRHLIVPPKAGYGGQDIGAGPGGMLHFDITLLEVR
jgi:FKBP-type peptidyl-prolyl cis-trans isomerase